MTVDMGALYGVDKGFFYSAEQDDASRKYEKCDENTDHDVICPNCTGPEKSTPETFHNRGHRVDSGQPSIFFRYDTQGVYNGSRIHPELNAKPQSKGKVSVLRRKR